MRKRHAAIAPVLAFWMGAPSLNAGTIAFIAIVIGWRYAALRLVLAFLGILTLSLLAARVGGDQAHTPVLPEPPDRSAVPEPGLAGWLLRWVRASARLAVALLPIYVVTVLLLGFARAWLFPIGGLDHWGTGPLIIAGLALAGMLFSIPTAGEVPIVQALLAAGLAAGPAAALLLTLPMVSLPSLLMLRTVLPGRALAVVGAGVWALGLLAGLLVALVPV